jgi:hypothetical protein
MFKVSIKNLKENKLWEAKFESIELAQEWLSKQIGKPHRLPEREVKFQEELLLEDIKEIKEAVLDDRGEIIEVKKAILKSEFEYEIVDLSLDPEFVRSEIKQKRFNEYPSELEIIEALMENLEGRPEKLAEVAAKRLTVKAKYPLEK